MHMQMQIWWTMQVHLSYYSFFKLLIGATVLSPLRRVDSLSHSWVIGCLSGPSWFLYVIAKFTFPGAHIDLFLAGLLSRINLREARYTFLDLTRFTFSSSSKIIIIFVTHVFICFLSLYLHMHSLFITVHEDACYTYAHAHIHNCSRECFMHLCSYYIT